MRAFFTLLFLLGAVLANADSYHVFEENGKVGLKNDQGAVVLPASFQALGWSDGSFSVIGEVTGYRIDQQWGIVNLKKEFITKAIYESLVYQGGNCIVAQKKINPVLTKSGCLDLLGATKIPFVYDGITVVGLRAVVFNLNHARYQVGLVDLDNREIIPSIYKNILPLGSLRYAVQNQSGKIALFSEQGKPISDFDIDSIAGFHKNHAVIYRNLKQGLIDRDGNLALEPKYKSIDVLDLNRAKVELPDQWLVITPKNETVNQLVADDLIPSGNDFIVRESGNYGVVNRELKLILPTQYEHLARLSEGRWIAKQKGKYGVIDESGTPLVSFRFDSLTDDPHGYRALTRQGWSLIDKNGKEKTYKSYAYLGGASLRNLHPSNYKGYWGLLDQNGDEVIHCVYDSLIQFSNELLVVKFKGKYGIINAREDWLVAPQAHPMEIVKDGLYLLRTPKNIFLKRLNGEVLYFTNNRIRLEKDLWFEILPDGVEKAIDYEGRIINRTAVPEKTQKLFVASEGLMGIQRDGKFGFVDSRGRLRIANRYDSIQDFQEGLAPVKLIGKWGFVNTDDKIVINPNYESVKRFKNGLAIAKQNKKAGIINTSAKIILGFQYDQIEQLPNANFLLTLAGTKGLADKVGTILLEPRFDSLEELGNGFVIVGRAKKFGVITPEGLSIIPMEYAKLTFDPVKNLFLALKKSEAKELSID